jgi:hypothetical protein
VYNVRPYQLFPLSLFPSDLWRGLGGFESERRPAVETATDLPTVQTSAHGSYNTSIAGTSYPSFSTWRYSLHLDRICRYGYRLYLASFREKHSYYYTILSYTIRGFKSMLVCKLMGESLSVLRIPKNRTETGWRVRKKATILHVGM